MLAELKPGSESARVTGLEDWAPTFMEILGEKALSSWDGISFAPTLFGKEQPERPFLYRESPGYTGQQAVRQGKWKLVRTQLNPGPKVKNPKKPTLELFDISTDPNEEHDVAAAIPKW